MQRKVWLAAFASFTTVCVGFWGYSATQDRVAALRDLERQTTTTARLLEEQAERAFEAGEHVLSLLAEVGRPDALRQSGVGQRAFERLRAAVGRSPQIGSAWLLSAQGDNLLDSWDWPPRPGNGSERPYFRAHRDGWRDLFIGAPASGSVTGTNRFTLSRPLLDAQGQLEAVAVVGVHAHYFEQFYREAGLGAGSLIQLLTADGTALASWPAEIPARAATDIAELVERLRQDPTGTTSIIDQRILSYRVLPTLPVVVAVLAPLAPVLADWHARMLRSGLVLVAALLGFGLLVVMGLRLARQQRLALIELDQAKATLEARVQERTADLEQREGELRLIADAVPALVAYIDTEQRYRFVNQAYEDWFGQERETVRGRTVREVLGEEAYEIAADNVRKALAGERIAYQTVMPYRDGGPRFIDAQYIPQIGPDGRTQGCYAFVIDVTTRRRAEAALRESEARYRALAEAIAAVIWTTRPDGYVVDMPQWRAVTGQTVEEVRGSGWLDAVHPDDRERTRELWQRSVDAGSVCDLEYRIRASDGQYHWFNGRGIAVRDEEGQVREWVGVCIDITERKAAEERQALLTGELDHRVRNILASIQSMVTLTGRSAASTEAYAEALRGRIAAMARTHDLLTRARWSGASLAQIVRDELEPYDPDGQVVRVDGAVDCLLRPRQALNFALVLHELATNAAKHGALSVPGGRVEVSWRLETKGGDRQVRLVWQESGGPPVSQPERRGFGSTLIESALRGEPTAEVQLQFAPAGVRCVITLRLDDSLRGGATPAGSAARAERAAPPLADKALQGARLLLVEDETLAAVELRLALSELGAEVAGPATSVAEGTKLAAENALDAAILDVNLGGERIDALADLLAAQGVPMVFVTGYDETALPPRLRHHRVLQKPIAHATLVNCVHELLAGAATSAATA